VATNIVTGREVVLSKGPALEAVMASAAVPAVWPPVEIDGQFLMDGGVGSHAPVTEAVELGATRIVLLTAGYSCRLGSVPETPLEMLVQALLIAQVRQLITELDTYEGRIPIHVVQPPWPIDVSPYDFSQAAFLIDAARTAAKKWLEEGGLESTRLPPTLQRARGP
jgi:NTE family protein